MRMNNEDIKEFIRTIRFPQDESVAFDDRLSYHDALGFAEHLNDNNLISEIKKEKRKRES